MQLTNKINKLLICIAIDWLSFQKPHSIHSIQRGGFHGLFSLLFTFRWINADRSWLINAPIPISRHYDSVSLLYLIDIWTKLLKLAHSPGKKLHLKRLILVRSVFRQLFIKYNQFSTERMKLTVDRVLSINQRVCMCHCFIQHQWCV